MDFLADIEYIAEMGYQARQCQLDEIIADMVAAGAPEDDDVQAQICAKNGIDINELSKCELKYIAVEVSKHFV